MKTEADFEAKILAKALETYANGAASAKPRELCFRRAERHETLRWRLCLYHVTSAGGHSPGSTSTRPKTSGKAGVTEAIKSSGRRLSIIVPDKLGFAAKVSD